MKQAVTKQAVGRAAVVFAALLIAGVALVVVGAWFPGADGEVLGYVGGGLIGGALAFFVLRMFELGDRRAA